MKLCQRVTSHFIHEINTKGHDVIGVNVFLRRLMTSCAKKRVENIPSIPLIKYVKAYMTYFMKLNKYFVGGPLSL